MQIVSALAVGYFALPLVYLVVGFGVIWWARRGIDRAVGSHDAADAIGPSELPEIESVLALCR